GRRFRPRYMSDFGEPSSRIRLDVRDRDRHTSQLVVGKKVSFCDLPAADNTDVHHRRARLRSRSFDGNSMTRPGAPRTKDNGGTSRVTTAPAAMNDPSPSRTPGRIVAPAPIVTPSSRM